MDYNLKIKREKILKAGWLIGVWALFPASISLYLGKSVVQLVDLLRRVLETFSIFMSWLGIKKINKLYDSYEVRKIENVNNFIIACVMFISFLVIIYLSIHRFIYPVPYGILWPGIIVASVDLIVNIFFAVRNYHLSKEKKGKIMASQSKLYTLKSTVNLSVLISLISIYLIKNKFIVNIINLSCGILIALFMLVTSLKVACKINKEERT